MSLRPNEKAIHWAEALGLSAVVHVGAAYLLFNFTVDLDRLIPEKTPERPDLLITSLVLDNNAIVSATSQSEGIENAEPIDAANEDLDGEFADPETLDPLTPTDDIVDPVVPEDPIDEVTPDIDQAENVTEPEVIPEVVEPDPAGDPDEVEPPVEVAAVTETPDEIDPIDGTDPIDAPAPDTIDPIDQTTGNEPDPISPLQPQESDAPAATGSTTGEQFASLSPTTGQASPERITPRLGIGTISNAAATAAAARPVRSLPTIAPPAPGTPEAVVSELVSRIRTNVSDTCLIAIPQMAANGAPELLILTASEADVAPYASAILDGIEPRPGQRSVLMDARQCAVLDYVRQNRSYPAFRMSFGLEIDQITSGDELTGAVGGTAGRYVSLIMIDDNGVVQDLGKYLSFVGDKAQFDVPLRRAGATRDTKQLLVAIGTNSRPQSVDAQNGQLASDYFDALASEVGTNIPIVMLPFDVR